MPITDPPKERPKNNFGICSSAPHPNPLPGVPGRGSYSSAVPNPRREWLTAAFRWLSLAGMAMVATVLGLRRSPGTGQPDCLRELPCRQCGLNRQCELPRAAAWRDAKERNT
jgi:hypothetical protein